MMCMESVPSTRCPGLVAPLPAMSVLDELTLLVHLKLHSTILKGGSPREQLLKDAWRAVQAAMKARGGTHQEVSLPAGLIWISFDTCASLLQPRPVCPPPSGLDAAFQLSPAKAYLQLHHHTRHHDPTLPRQMPRTSPVQSHTNCSPALPASALQPLLPCPEVHQEAP